MRYILLLIALLNFGLMPLRASDHTVDSLHAALVRTTIPAEQIRIYRNLADLTAETPAACGYLLGIVEKAQPAGYIRPMMEALTDLTINYISSKKIDSARYAIALAKKYVPDGQHDQWLCYLEMRMFSSDLLGEDAGQAMDDKIAAFKSREIDKENPYQQIETEFALGTTLYFKDQFEEALPHLLHALELTEKLPFRDGCPYQLIIIRQLSGIYSLMREPEKAVDIIKRSIGIKERYYELYDQPERPFYSLDDFYITNYGSLLINIPILPDNEAKYYLDQLVEMSDRSNNPTHKYSRFHAQFNYNSYHRNYQQALIYNDSLIHYARKIAVYNLPGMYQINSLIYEALGKDKLALKNLREYHRLQDSIRESDSQEKYDKLRVEYDVNRLNYENSQLANRNKHILIICLSIILLSAIIGCIYLYIHLKKEQERKQREQALKMRAEESEKLKTAFINSICHEIRTPLNGIVGYSELMLDPSIDDQIRNTFPPEIQRNTSELVALIDSMLEVSHLDVSDEKLPCLPIDVARLCRTTFEQYTDKYSAPDIVSEIQLPDGPLIAPTHERYLTLVIGNLLDNAYKFTEQGRITLCCRKSSGKVEISVTDTGCGIPIEKHLVVFERFTKLDTYKQGGGLGLYLSKLVVHRLSGKIFIDPEYSSGTRVIVVIPIA